MSFSAVSASVIQSHRPSRLHQPGDERERRGALEQRTLLTNYSFTGQRSEFFGLYDYHARFYDPYPDRFISAEREPRAKEIHDYAAYTGRAETLRLGQRSTS